MKNKYINLDNRLKACADMIRLNSNIVDIGTDHAYLPIYLAQRKLISHAIAADIKSGPLSCALNNIYKYHVCDTVETRLSNGLDNISPNEVDDIIISGMGGETIIDIIKKAEWIKNSKKQLILQPMSMAKNLREYLLKENFDIKKEKIVFVGKHVYTIMMVKFTKEKLNYNELSYYIGGIEFPLSTESIYYLKREIQHIENNIKGFKKANNLIEVKKAQDIITSISNLFK